MIKCEICGKKKDYISQILPLCRECIINRFDECIEFIKRAHEFSHLQFNLPPAIPHSNKGVKCSICGNNCVIEEGSKGYCGINRVENQKLVIPDKVPLDWYYDNLPTNCVAEFVCPGRTEYGYKNLAIFYRGCNFDCLFCQNWHFRDQEKTNLFSPLDIITLVDSKTRCICFFGGDPVPFILHTIKIGETIIKNKIKKVVRICWETNGSMNKNYLLKILEIAYKTGGIIKFDLKFFTEKLNIALCGVSNKTTLENLKIAGEYARRKEYPLIVVSTLMIPGYINEEEIDLITKFIASINPDIPFSLLGFHSSYLMSETRYTTKIEAEKYYKIARKNGIKNVHIGNRHILI